MSGFHRCHGKDLLAEVQQRRRDSPGKAIYISPEEKRFIEAAGITDLLHEPVCRWPACDCPLRTIAGAYHAEKIDWIIEQRQRDPKFKVTIRI